MPSKKQLLKGLLIAEDIFGFALFIIIVVVLICRYLYVIASDLPLLTKEKIDFNQRKKITFLEKFEFGKHNGNPNSAIADDLTLFLWVLLTVPTDGHEIDN